MTASLLYHIDECPDVMLDAYIGDESGNLVFLSLWARDTAVQQFLARLTLGRDEQGLEQFHIITEQGGSLPVFVGDVERLQKRSARVYRRTLFGALTHLWLFDQRCVRPDKTHASALALLPRAATLQPERLWALVQKTCPLPLLDHWRDGVLDVLKTHDMLNLLPVALGPLQAYRLAMDVEVLTQTLGDLIRREVLATEPTQHKANQNHASNPYDALPLFAQAA